MYKLGSNDSAVSRLDSSEEATLLKQYVKVLYSLPLSKKQNPGALKRGDPFIIFLFEKMLLTKVQIIEIDLYMIENCVFETGHTICPYQWIENPGKTTFSWEAARNILSLWQTCRLKRRKDLQMSNCVCFKYFTKVSILQVCLTCFKRFHFKKSEQRKRDNAKKTQSTRGGYFG